MSTLREAALVALRASEEARARKEEARRQQHEKEAFERVSHSDLGAWFPDVKWQLVKVLDDITVLVHDQEDANSIVLGVRLTRSGAVDQGPDEWEVGIYGPAERGMPGTWKRKKVVESPAEIGAYIQANEPRGTN